MFGTYLENSCDRERATATFILNLAWASMIGDLAELKYFEVAASMARESNASSESDNRGPRRSVRTFQYRRRAES